MDSAMAIIGNQVEMNEYIASSRLVTYNIPLNN